MTPNETLLYLRILASLKTRRFSIAQQVNPWEREHYETRQTVPFGQNRYAAMVSGGASDDEAVLSRPKQERK